MFWVVRTLDVVKYLGFGLMSCRIDFVGDTLGLERREEAIPEQLMLQITPVPTEPLELFIGVLWLPRSESCSSASGLPRRQTAINYRGSEIVQSQRSLDFIHSLGSHFTRLLSAFA